jgi:hypothetical protein
VSGSAPLFGLTLAFVASAFARDRFIRSTISGGLASLSVGTIAGLSPPKE